MIVLLLALLLIPIMVIYSAFSWGYVASIIYTWFILPTFPDAPTLLWWELAGIMFFINCFVHESAKDTIKKEYKEEYSGLIGVIIHPWLVLLGAWIFKILIF